MTEAPSQLDLELLRAKSKESLYFFAKGILGYDWLTPHIHEPVCRVLEEAVSTTNPTNRLLIELPRGWLKTTLCTIAFSMWLSIRRPNIRILLVQNSSTNACKKLASIRGQWESNDLLRVLFPELLPGRNSTWKADALCLSRSASFPEATYEAAGTSTRVVSRHYDVVIEDDTVAPEYDELGQESLAPSCEDVEKAIGWHRTNVLPLLNNPAEDLSLVVGTRWYDQDLIRYIKDKEPQYKVITRACRENDEGKPDYRGRITYPERFNEKVLTELELGLGQYMFGCLYMNTPVRHEDMIFKPEWFRYYETTPRLSDLAIYTTIDCATDPSLSKSDDLDSSVVMTCGKDPRTGYVYVLEYFHKRCNPGAFISAIFDHVTRWCPVLVGYQNQALEKSIGYWLREMMRQESYFFHLQALKLPNAKGAKNMRIEGLQPLFANGVILIRPHMRELVSELLKFPLGAHDDLSDTLSMQLALWRMTKGIKKTRDDPTADPFSLDAACKELRSRTLGRHKSPIFDPARAASSVFEFQVSNN